MAIHVAGIIEVGPAENTTRGHMEHAMNIMAWGPVNLADAVVARMRKRQRGRFAVVTSIGVMLSAPHLLAYSTAKFAAVGFTEGLAASLAGSGVTASVVAPGLMRTGSHAAAEFYGDRQREYAWFAPAASLPLVSMDAQRAAHAIVGGVLAGKPYVILTPAANHAETPSSHSSSIFCRSSTNSTRPATESQKPVSAKARLTSGWVRSA